MSALLPKSTARREFLQGQTIYQRSGIWNKPNPQCQRQPCSSSVGRQERAPVGQDLQAPQPQGNLGHHKFAGNPSVTRLVNINTSDT